MNAIRPIAILLVLWPLAAGADKPPPGPFTQAECVECHTERDPTLVAQWRDGPHATAADCVACHGKQHGALPTARDDAACTTCHDGPVAHSYTTSKHGVIVTLERPAWQQPLARGNYRAPGCAYCHLHDRDHGDSMDGTRGRHLREWVCGGCHAPRYVADQFAAGAELLAIGDLKAREAEELAHHHPGGRAAVGDLLERVNQHMRNLRLGAGHQSPDYQWWHGHPALDGDLIRLRQAVAEARRQ